MSETLTHKDLAKLCGVSETTIKSYRRKFPTFIPVHTDGKPIRFKPEAGAISLCIRDCFAKGMSINETYKVLKGKFKEISRKELKRPAGAPSVATGAGMEGVSKEYLDKFFETAGQMMHGMAQMATAQARADRRLEKVEKVLGSLADIEGRNEQMFTALLDHLKASPPEGEARKTARRIINVRGAEGIKSYAFEGQENTEFTGEKEEDQRSFSSETASSFSEQEPGTTTTATQFDTSSSQTGHDAADHVPSPSDTFMQTPIVIRTEQGEFLGLPGRIALGKFIEAVLEQGESGGAVKTLWERRDRSWVFSMSSSSGESHELFFGGTKTPRGNLVVLFWQLDVNGEPTSPAFLQEFFRQIKDRLVD